MSCFGVNPDKNPERKKKFHFEAPKVLFKSISEFSQ
jgi:hypothetical protein